MKEYPKGKRRWAVDEQDRDHPFVRHLNEDEFATPFEIVRVGRNARGDTYAYCEYAGPVTMRGAPLDWVVSFSEPVGGGT